MTVASTGHITLTSNPHKKRVGLIPLCAVIAVLWMGGLAYVAMAIMTFQRNPELSIGIIIMMSGLGFVLSIFGYSLLRDSYQDYVLELTDTEAVLIVIDRLRKRKGTQMVLLDDISYAEYHPYADSALVILHTSYTDMQVPLWPMTNQGRDVIDYLDGRGVRVINVQSDDPIPD